MEPIDQKKNNMSSVNDKDITDLKVDVGILKTQTNVLSQLCEKMDKIIEKLVDNQDKHINQVYREIDKRRSETDEDVGELHERIDTILDRVHRIELLFLEEMKHLRTEIANNNREEKEKLDQLFQWKWTVAGGIVALSWLITHFNLDIIKNLFTR